MPPVASSEHPRDPLAASKASRGIKKIGENRRAEAGGTCKGITTRKDKSTIFAVTYFYFYRTARHNTDRFHHFFPSRHLDISEKELL